jgi:hypothetical protein
MNIKRLALVTALLLQSAFLSSCGGGGSEATVPPPVATDISVLMFGNSHTANNDLPGMLAAMLRAGRPGKTVQVVNAPEFLFLDERLLHADSLNLFRRQHWGALVLQAQRYSTSGTVDYSILEAAAWVRSARSGSTMPIMFPEWPRRGINEAARIFELHLRIAALAPVCVPPIPQAFDLAAIRFPLIVLHAADGNHSSPAGAFLAALILFSTMTATPPIGLPFLPGFGISELTQQQLRAVADEQLRLISALTLCPGDVRF